MRAAVYHGPGDLRVETLPDPVAEPGGLVVRVAACAICGTDLRVLTHGQANVRIPQVLGHEIVGTIAEVGPTTTGYQVGDAVALRPGVVCGACESCQSGWQNLCQSYVGGFGYALQGGFAEYVAVPAKGVQTGTVIPLPREVDFAALAIFEPLACVLNGQEYAGVGLGDTAVVIGAGPIGCMHVVAARLRGARRIIVVDLLRTRLNLAERFDPDLLIDASAEDPVQRVLEATGGLGASVAIVAASSGVAQEQAVRMVRPRGRAVFFAGLPHSQPEIKLDSNLVHYRQMAVYGVKGSAFRHQNEALRLLATRTVDGRRLVTDTLGLAEATEGFRRVRSGEALKVVLIP